MENEQSVESNTKADDSQFDTKEEYASQRELIKQWRETLEHLKKDVDIKKTGNSLDEKANNVINDIDYLDQKNALLDENDDFILSDAGFLTYQTKHIAVFDYLSKDVNLIASNSNSNFYLISINKHVEQCSKPSYWKHSLAHFLLIPIACLLLGLIAYLMTKQSQSNMIVRLLLILCASVYFHSFRSLLITFKDSIVTPLRFKVSLFSIYLFNMLVKLVLICVIPILLIYKVKNYWVDDTIIISLFIFLFSISLYGENKKKDSINSTEKESTDA